MSQIVMPGGKVKIEGPLDVEAKLIIDYFYPGEFEAFASSLKIDLSDVHTIEMGDEPREYRVIRYKNGPNGMHYAICDKCGGTDMWSGHHGGEDWNAVPAEEETFIISNVPLPVWWVK